jgi:hypothetical protein
MNATEQQEWLSLARAWKRGELRPVHPIIGRMFNQALARVGEDCVPFRLSTSEKAPSLAELVRREYLCASVNDQDAEVTPLRRLFAQTEQERADVGTG